ncbi:unnamed protein product [Rotaria sordida]|uniref:Receptor ligand binding region domain-containing protein n=1 Tax=Rotaria sordida TaxID=392033 RepID=A0A815TX25_9BILA|nr:unnamed protein product [Rotaria sordida]
MFSFTESDLSLSSIDCYPFFYHIVPSDRGHNLVRKQLLQYFNWTRFGLIYQHGSKYTWVANDLSNLTAIDKKQWEVNLTRGIAYRHELEWHDDNAKNMKGLLNDFETRDVRIIIANFNQTIATHMFCHEQPSYVLDYLEQFSKFERNYFDAYAYDTIWSLAYLYQSKFLSNETNLKTLVDN